LTQPCAIRTDQVVAAHLLQAIERADLERDASVVLSCRFDGATETDLGMGVLLQLLDQLEIELPLLALQAERIGRAALQPRQVELGDQALAPVSLLREAGLEPRLHEHVGNAVGGEHVQRRRMEGRGPQIFHDGGIALEHLDVDARVGQHHCADQAHRPRTGANFTHAPYRGNAQAMTDLLGGTLQMGFINTPVAAPFLKDGRLRALAVTSNVRSPLLPEVPTVAEALNLPDFDFNGWFGLFAPKGTPAPVIAKLSDAVGKALADAKVRKIFIDAGAMPMELGAADFAKFVAEERGRIDPLLEKRKK